MDIYGISTPDYFRIDDLLDLSNDEIFSTATDHLHLSAPENSSIPHYSSSDSFSPALSTDFTDGLYVPVCYGLSDDVAELEWLSQFIDDSFRDFPPNSLACTVKDRSVTSFCCKARGKSSKGTVPNASPWISSPAGETASPATGKTKVKKETSKASSPTADGGVRRCTHCASEKTPQWRTGPLGPKTLCNACGVRYKSGRLVPEYRPAASPTFVLTQHSNSHRKVLELRRQKEMLRQRQQQQQVEQDIFHSHRHNHHHQPDFEVC